MAVELGLIIDSSGMKPGLADLDTVVQKSQAAEQAATKMGQTVSGAMKQAGQGTSEVASGLKATAAAADTAGKSVNEAANAHASLSTQGQAALHSIRGFTEQITMGVPPTQALTSHINQLAYAASGQGGLRGAFSEVAGVIGGLITPTTALIGGVAAVGAGAYVAVESWKSFGTKLDDVSHITGTTIEQMAKLQAAASFKGIDTEQFQSGMSKFAASVYDAQNGVGQLANVLRANGESAQDFSGYMDAAANIIQRAASDQERLQLLQQMGLPATQEWVRLLSGGAKGLHDAQNEAANFGQGTAELVAKAREFDDGWNKAWTNFGLHARAGIQEAIEAYGQFGERIANGFGLFGGQPGGLPVPTSAPASGGPGSSRSGGSGDAVDPATLQKNNALLQARVQILGASASVEDRILEAENAITLARINGVDISKSEGATLLQQARESAEAAQNQFQYTQQLKADYGDVSSSTAQILANLEAQSAVASAVTGQDQIDAQYNATIVQLLMQGKDAREAALIASQQMANAEDAVDASIQRQVIALNQQTELIAARQNGDEASVAAAQAYANAMERGASATEAAALSSATLANYSERAAVAAEQQAAQEERSAAAAAASAAQKKEEYKLKNSLNEVQYDLAVQTNNWGNGSEGFNAGPVNLNELNPGGGLGSNIPGYGSGFGYDNTTAGYQAVADRAKSNGESLQEALNEVTSVRDKFGAAGYVYRSMANNAAQPVIDSLNQQIAALTQATKDNTDATKNLSTGLDSIYSGGHSALAIGYYGEGEKNYNYDPNGFFQGGQNYTAPSQPYDPAAGYQSPSGGGLASIASSTVSGPYTGTVVNPNIPGYADGGVIEPYSLAYVGEHSSDPKLIRAGAEPIVVTPNVPSTSSAAKGLGTVINQTFNFTARANDIGDRRTRRQITDGYGNAFRAVA